MAATVLPPPPANGALAHLTHEDTPAASKPISDIDWPEYDEEEDEAEAEQLGAEPQRERSHSPPVPSPRITTTDIVTPASAASPPNEPGPLPERDAIATSPPAPLQNGLPDHDAEIVDSASDERADTPMGGSGVLVDLDDASPSPSSSKALEPTAQQDDSMAVDAPGTETPFSDSTKETSPQVPGGFDADVESTKHLETTADPESQPESPKAQLNGVNVVTEHGIAVVDDVEGEDDFSGSEESEEDPNIARIDELEDENRQLRAVVTSRFVSPNFSSRLYFAHSFTAAV